MSFAFNCPRCALGSDAQAGAPLLRLGLVMVLVGGLAGLEWLVSRHSHSLSLLADAGHLAGDGVALGLALGAAWVAQRSVQPQAAAKLGAIAALVNGLGLTLMAMLVAWESWAHLGGSPSEILTVPMGLTALVGMGVNGLNAWILRHHSRQSLNLRGAFLHVVADALSSVGVLLAAIAAAVLHWAWVDTAIGLGVALLIGFSGLPLVGQSWRALRPPVFFEIADLQQGLLRLPGVTAVHLQLQPPGQLGGHVVIAAGTPVACDRISAQIQQTCRDWGLEPSGLDLVPTDPSDLVGFHQLGHSQLQDLISANA